MPRHYRWDQTEGDYNFEMIKEDILKPAFRELRKKGYIARMNFACCGSCAGYELNEDAKKRGKDGVINWNRQEDSSARSYGNNGKIHIAYNLSQNFLDKTLPMEYSQEDKDELIVNKIGKDIVEALSKASFAQPSDEWDCYKYGEKVREPYGYKTYVVWNWDSNRTVELHWEKVIK